MTCSTVGCHAERYPDLTVCWEHARPEALDALVQSLRARLARAADVACGALPCAHEGVEGVTCARCEIDHPRIRRALAEEGE